jgi:hypothetical protein
LPHETQGSERRGVCTSVRVAARRLVPPLTILVGPALAALLAGCAGGMDLRDAAVDETIKTASTGAPTSQPEDALLSDQSTIRDAVSSADPEAIGADGFAWANDRTGSRGSVTALVETTRRGLPCRRFVTSRESYDGVKLYRGEVCRVVGDLWQVRSFQEG